MPPRRPVSRFGAAASATPSATRWPDGPERQSATGAGGAPSAAAAAAEMARFRARVLRLVTLIPPGRVASYGQIAALAGHPRRARHVGNALKHAPEGAVPWHRVVNAAGGISARGGEQRVGIRNAGADQTIERRQAVLLAAEGVPLTGRGAAQRVDLARYRWRPEEEGAAMSLGLGARRSPKNQRRGRRGGRP